MEISGAAALEDAGANELSFAYGRKGIAAARGSGAGCLIVDADFPSGRTLLRAPDPRAWTIRSGIRGFASAAVPTVSYPVVGNDMSSANISASNYCRQYGKAALLQGVASGTATYGCI